MDRWEALSPTFCDDNGRPGLPVRLMVGLHYLKYTWCPFVPEVGRGDIILPLKTTSLYHITN